MASAASAAVVAVVRDIHDSVTFAVKIRTTLFGSHGKTISRQDAERKSSQGEECRRRKTQTDEIFEVNC